MDAILELTSNVTESLDRKEKAIGMFLDLSKAFDTVSVPILIRRLEEVGIRGIVLNIFKDYLSNRFQRVKIGNCISQEEKLTYGVPQGSVLGPTLFLVYINKLCLLSFPLVKIVAYADDMAIIVRGKNWTETQTNAERVLEKIMLWLSSNLLSLNLGKSKYITFSLNKHSQPQKTFLIKAHNCGFKLPNCNCNIMERADSMKYLGVILDSTLSWAPQIDKLVGQARKMIYIFKNLKFMLDLKTMKIVYFALVQSILSYCITCWGNCAKTLLLRLERAQRAILKVMMGKPILFPTRELYGLCDVLTVRQIYILQVILRKHKQLPFDPSLQHRKRRFDKVCQIKYCRTRHARKHFSYASSIIYNKINCHLNIYPATYRSCKILSCKWLKTLSYSDTEDIVTFK